MDHTWELGRLMFAMKNQIDALFSVVAASCGVTPLQMTVLLFLQKGPTTLKSLRQTLHMNQGNASTLCKKMEQEGFLRRIRDPKDERIVQLALTPDGQRIALQLQAQLDKLAAEVNAAPQSPPEPACRSLEPASAILDHFRASVQEFLHTIIQEKEYVYGINRNR